MATILVKNPNPVTLSESTLFAQIQAERFRLKKIVSKLQFDIFNQKVCSLVKYIDELAYKEAKSYDGALYMTKVDTFLFQALVDLNTVRSFSLAKEVEYTPADLRAFNDASRTIINQLIVNQELMLDAIVWLRDFLSLRRQAPALKITPPLSPVDVPAAYAQYYRTLLLAGGVFINPDNGFLICPVLKTKNPINENMIRLYQADRLLEDRAKVALLQLNRMLHCLENPLPQPHKRLPSSGLRLTPAGLVKEVE